MAFTVGQYLRAMGAAQAESRAASDARTDLGLVYGTDVLVYSAKLQSIADIGVPALNTFIVGDGTKWVGKTAAQTRVALGLEIGVNVQAYDADLAAIAGLMHSANAIIVSSGGAWTAMTPADARTALGAQEVKTGLTQIGNLSPYQGCMLYHDGSTWTLLAPGTSNSYLAYNTATAKPYWNVAPAYMLKSTYDANADGKIDLAAGGLGADISGLSGVLFVSAGSVSAKPIGSGGVQGYSSRLADLSAGTKTALSAPTFTGTWSSDKSTLQSWLNQVRDALIAARVVQ